MAKIRKGDFVRFTPPVIEGEVINTSVNEDGDVFHTVQLADGHQHVLNADLLVKFEVPETAPVDETPAA